MIPVNAYHSASSIVTSDITAVVLVTPHWGAADAEIKVPSGENTELKRSPHLVRAQSFNVLPLKSGVGQYIAIHVTLTARDFFFAYFYSSGPFTCIFLQNLS